jgi:hypothetical protein
VCPTYDGTFVAPFDGELVVGVAPAEEWWDFDN